MRKFPADLHRETGKKQPKVAYMYRIDTCEHNSSATDDPQSGKLAKYPASTKGVTDSRNSLSLRVCLPIHPVWLSEESGLGSCRQLEG